MLSGGFCGKLEAIRNELACWRLHLRVMYCFNPMFHDVIVVNVILKHFCTLDISESPWFYLYGIYHNVISKIRNIERVKTQNLTKTSTWKQIPSNISYKNLASLQLLIWLILIGFFKFGQLF